MPTSECGAAGPFLIEAGISSSFHIAKFFGLTSDGARLPLEAEIEPITANVPAVVQPDFGHPHVEERDTTEASTPKFGGAAGRIDIGAVISKALQAAGLLK